MDERRPAEPIVALVSARRGEGKIEAAPPTASEEQILEAEIVETEGSVDAVAPPSVPAPQTPPAPESSTLRSKLRSAASAPRRSDFLSWRSSLAGSAVAAAPRHGRWPRLFGFIAAALIFAALVALVVLVAL